MLLAMRGFHRNDCPKSASSLTYYSLLNIVPLFAVTFAMAKGFGLAAVVEKRILHMAAEANWQAEATGRIIAFSQSLLEHTRGGVIAGVGIILLFWTVISIFEKIEGAFNITWGIKKPRPLARKFSDYVAMMILGPVLFVISGSINLFVATALKNLVVSSALLGAFGSVVFFLMKVLSYASVWLLLTMLYLFMPNTRVRPAAAVLGGAVAGALYLVVQWVYIRFQVGITSYGAIYGSFAALPLLLVWIQTSWMIVLLGGEVASASEHSETYGFHPDYSRIGIALKERLLLGVFHLVVRRFARGEEPPSGPEISRLMEIPLRLVEDLLSGLIDAGLIAVVEKGGAGSPLFHPAQSVEEMTLKGVLDRYERSAEAGEGSGQIGKIAACLGEMALAAEKSPGYVRLGEL
jgi:membrane protein